MSHIIHSNHHHILHCVQEDFDEQKIKSLKIVCSDGIVFCDRLLFILWSKFWESLLNQEESVNTLIIPDIKVEIIRQIVHLLTKGKSEGFDSDLRIFLTLFWIYFLI